jgi:hypothetical protein
MKDNWIFQNIKDNVNALHQTFGKHMFVMNLINMVFIQTLNKFRTTIENAKDIQFINSNSN